MLDMHEQLEEYLDALARDECYRVDAVLKASPHEMTERVFFVGSNGAEYGPLIRKRLDLDCGMGSAYLRLWEAQRAGQRFLHVPRMVDCYSTEDAFVVIMEFIEGETLADAVWRLDPSPTLACDLFYPLCDAVMELHERFDPPMIHRDLKPSNIMVSPGGNVTIIDFGIAREYRTEALSDTRSFGTRSYAPPEQFGYGQTDERSDVYALGMILFYCLTEQTADAALVRSGFAEANVPDALRPVLAKATAFDPSDRFPSVRALREAFASAMSYRALPGAADDAAFAPATTASAATAPLSATSASAAPTAITHTASTSASATSATASPLSRLTAFAQRTVSICPSRLRQLRIPAWIGVVWNALLVATWLLFTAVTTALIAEPAESLASFAPWGRVLFGYAVGSISPGAIAYLLMDKRPIRQRFPHFPTLRTLRAKAFCLAFAFLFPFVACGIAMLSL